MPPLKNHIMYTIHFEDQDGQDICQIELNFIPRVYERVFISDKLYKVKQVYYTLNLDNKEQLIQVSLIKL